MPVYLNSKIKVNEGENNFVVDTPELYSNDATYEYYSGERMYPPTRTLSSSAHTISGESYGNGLYITDQSTYHSSQWAGFSAFRESVNVGYHGAGSQYNTSGTYLKSHYIISDYKGEWLTIKMPTSIYLTRYAFTLRSTTYLGRAPKKYKIYGSNNGTDWEVLVHKDDLDATPVYTNSRFEESIQMTNKSYNYFGLVVNKLIGSSNTDSLNLNEWYIYGKELITTAEKSYEEQTNITEYTILESDSTNLVAWYKFDGNANDSSGNDYHLTIVNNGANVVQFSSTEKVIGQSANLLSTDAYLEIPSTTLTLSNTPFSICFWVKIPSNSQNSSSMGLISELSESNGENTTAYNQLSIYKNTSNGYGMTYLGGYNINTSSYNSDEDTWIHLVFQHDDNHKRRIWRNGTLVFDEYTDSSFSAVNQYPNPLMFSDSKIKIGFWDRNDRDITGYMDDVRFYNSVLSENEIYYLANNMRLIPEYKYLTFKYDNTKYPHLDADDTNLKIWYKFDDNGNDSNPSSTKYNLTNNGVSFVDGIVNKAASFDNNADLLTSQTFHLSNTLETEFTFSLWIKVKSGISSYGQVFQYYQDGNNNIYMRRQNANYLIFWIFQNGANIGTSLSSSNYTLDEWRLYTITYNSMEARLYINGALHQSMATNGSVLRIRNGYLLIGDRTNSDQHFWGELDDFRIYDKALTESEISDLYNQYNQNKYYLTFNNPINCDILIVAGGGGGGGSPHAGGGGAGGIILLENYNLIANTIYNVRVGKGGEGGLHGNWDQTNLSKRGENGFDSYFDIYRAIGGGGGGRYHSLPGIDGGSGGGGEASRGSAGSALQPSSTYGGFGNNGALGVDGYKAGGGGGAGTAGSSSGAGGEGKHFDKFENQGTPNGWYGGGGGGSHYANSTILPGGKGGGGDGGAQNNSLGGGGEDGVDGTGGGGGGAERSGTQKGGNGGSGIVIIRYKNADINQWTYSYSDPNTYYLGNVGIGTLSSQENKLTIGGDLNVTNKIYKNNVEISNIDGWNKNGQNIYRETGKVGIGTTEPQYTLDINGDIYAMGGGVTGDGSTSWTTISDRNLKENIVKASYKECYDNIKNIDLYRFNYKKGFDTSQDKHQLGFIAQEVKEYYPKSVIETNNSAKGVDNILKLDVTQINYSLFGAVKHSIKEIEEIEEKIANNTN